MIHSVHLIHNWKVPIKSLPRGNTDIPIHYWPELSNMCVCWHYETKLRVLFHCYQTPDIEVGGVLLGEVYQVEPGNLDDFPRYFVEITASIAAYSPNIIDPKN